MVGEIGSLIEVGEEEGEAEEEIEIAIMNWK